MNTEPPPLKPKPSLYHRAANYGIAALVCSFVLNIVGTGVGRENAAAGRIFSLLIGFMMLSAIPAGIIGLLGIKKHGRKGLLWKSVLAVFIPIALSAIAVPAFLRAQSMSLQGQIAQVASEINKTAPQIVDEATRLDNVMQSGPRELTVFFTLTLLESAEIDRKVWEEEIVPKLRTNIRISVFGRLLKRGAHVKYVYTDSLGVSFAEINFTPKDVE